MTLCAIRWTIELEGVPILAVARHGFKFAPRVAIRDGGSQFGPLALPKIRWQHSTPSRHRGVAAARRDGLFGRRLKEVRSGCGFGNIGRVSLLTIHAPT